MKTSRVTKLVGRTLAGTAGFLIAAATLYPAGRQGAEAWACIQCGAFALADAIANMILFAPLGVALSLAGVEPRRAVVAGALLSSLIELAQGWIPGRDPSIRDLLSNTTGTGLGVVVVATAGYWLYPSRRLATILAVTWTAASAGVAWATVMLLHPAYPGSSYYGQWTPNLGHLEWYRGRVLEAQVGAVAVPSWQAENSDILRQELQHHSPIMVRAVAGPRLPALGSLFSIYDDQEREVILVGPDGEDLVYRFRSRATALQLDSPDLRARGLLRGIRPGDSLDVVVSWAGDDICLSANGRHACGLSPGASAGWSLLFFDGQLPAWLIAVLNAAWLAALSAPVGYWSAERRTLVLLGGTLTAATLAASAYGATLSLRDALFTAGGLVVGSLANLAVRARRQLNGPSPG